MVEYIKEISNIDFGEMYQSSFLPKGTGTDWRSAFRQQEELLKKAVNNITLIETNNFPLKESKLEEVGTILDDIKKGQGHIKTRKLR
ncbi:hypothetical protein [Wolbachia endosymbiont of Dirofilaria (Dirofilaria) immitis]|uniref:hypothetical protein n=1 Tax=Wolbachia endosymbiont of Dirofilaria (Dirofilaria) immitis TaxID=1812115 RepID=UPI00158CF674|nr:hypothetical protein [Wolbachia endosymbiont of Dirofilaria (Dirofilaria) immitis]QKX02094.1 hypothetical protein GOY12_00620 [Wolbachia endosymbiont of Dirofilaria (Dirofilaria) immitis]